MRMDSWPKTGGAPGSDLPMMQEQLLDLFDVAYGLLAPLVGGAPGERNVEFGAAMATAVNEWQIAHWCDPDPRLLGAIQVNIEHTEAAIAEIEKRAGDRRFAQVNIPPRGLEPLGRRRYWPILEACAANNFPVSLHLGGTSGHASTGGGWPSFYHEEHPSYVQTMQTLVTSLVCEGVFEQIPNLKIVLVEGGFAWLPRAVLASGQALEAPEGGGAAPEALAVRIRARTHLGHHPADRGAGAAAGHAVHAGVDRSRPGDVLHRLSALGPGRPALRVQDPAAGRLEAQDLPRQREGALQPGLTDERPPPNGFIRHGPARSGPSGAARSA